MTSVSTEWQSAFAQVSDTLGQQTLAGRVGGLMLQSVAQAGCLALSYFGKSYAELKTEMKADTSLLTIADEKTQAFLIDALEQDLTGVLPRLSFLAEEKRAAPQINAPENVIIIDPIDGTKQFASGSPEWAIAGAWATNTKKGLETQVAITLSPAAGTYTLSMPDLLLSGDVKAGSLKAIKLDEIKPTQVVSVWGNIKDPTDGPVLLSIMGGLAQQGYETRMIGSCVLMNERTARGVYDGAIIYSGHSIWAHPWDLASTHQIVQAGGVVTTMLGQPDPLNTDPHSMIAARDADTHQILLQTVQNAMKDAKAPTPAPRPLTKRFPFLKVG